MLEKLTEYKNESSIVFVPQLDYKFYDSINYTLGNAIKIDNVDEDERIITVINGSKIKKIYLLGNNDIYRFILPRINKSIEVCWIFNDSFSSLSNPGVRYNLNTIFEYYDRTLVDIIGCLNKDNMKVFENAGQKCEYVDLKLNKNGIKSIDTNSIGILSDDFDPNNNFYNQLVALTFIDYDVCKFQAIMKATTHFYKYFNIKSKVLKNIDDVMKDNFVNLYINFTNTNKELILKSYNYGVPVIVGNTDFYDNNKYLKEYLVVKSDDDVNEIAEKINFVKNNYKKIMEEYSKIQFLQEIYNEKT